MWRALPTVDNLDPNFQSDQQSKRTPLHAAAQKGSVEICHVLLQVSMGCPLPQWPGPWTPPAWPLPGSSPHAPSSQAGANINAVDKQQRTPLMEAVVNNHLEAARYMVQRGGCVYSKVPGGPRGPGAGLA